MTETVQSGGRPPALEPQAQRAARHHFRLEPLGGIAGDMFVAALLDAVPELEPRVRADLASILPSGTPAFPGVMRGGLRARRFELADLPPASHEVRWPELDARIAAAALAPGTSTAARAILRRLAEVEAAIHGTSLDDVHFHELADWDSLADVVAAGSIAAALPDAVWSVAPLPTGSGTIRSQHGLLPVPAPATLALLHGFAWHDDGIPGERVTPTGAAILATLVDPQAPTPAGGRLVSTGAGAGTRDLADLPNILRVVKFALTPPVPPSARRVPQPGPIHLEQVAVLSFEVDDMTPEELAVALDRLRARADVLDAAQSARIGKKGRRQDSVRLLVREGSERVVAEACLVETSTLGVRLRLEERLVLAREAAAVDGVPMKRAVRPDGTVTAKAESDALVNLPTLAERRRRARAVEDGP